MSVSDFRDGRARVESYIRGVVRWRWLVLTASVVLGLALGAGARDLGLSSDYRVFFGEGNPDLLEFEAMEDTYTKNDAVFFVIRPDSGRVFTPRTLDAIRDLTRDAWQIPNSTRVDSVTNFQHTEARGDELIVEDLYAPWAGSAEDAERAERIALAEPLLAGRLVSTDAHSTGINVRIVLDPADNSALPATVAHARALQADFAKRYPDHRIGLTGLTMLNASFAEAPLEDMPVVMPLMFTMLIVVMGLFLRSGAATGATFVIVLLATSATVGVAGYLGILLDPVSASVPTIVLTLAVADSIHILLTFGGALRAGRDREEAVVEAFRVNAQPVFLTSVTTAVGFLSLNSSDSPPFHLLGNLTALGVMFAWAFSMTTLPALMAMLPARPTGTSGVSTRLSKRIARLVVARPGGTAAVMSLIVVATVAATSGLVINDQFVDYFDERLAFRRDTDFTTDHLTGIYQVSYSIPSGDTQGVSDPDYLAAVDRFATWMRGRDGVVHVNSFTDTMKRLNRNMHGDAPQAHRLPGSRSLGAQYLLLYEMSLPYGLDVNDQIDVDKRSLRVDVTFGDVDTATIVREHRAALEFIARNGTEPMAETVGASVALMFSNIARRNIDGMILGTGLGFAIISLILGLALRDVRLGLISLVPNVLPAAMAFGVWALVYREVGFAVSVIAGLSIGIIVDDTVHFLSKFERARRELGCDASRAVEHAFEQVGPAIIGTTVIVAGGFAMLSLSSFRVTSYMGVLTSLSIVCALITDLLLLPALLIVFEPRRRSSPVALATSTPP